MIEQFDTWVRQLGGLGYLVLALAALIEHVVPPFPGDTIVLLGGAYAVRGERSAPLVLLAVTLGSMVGLTINYVLGRYLGGRLATMRDEQKMLGVSIGALRKVQVSMRERGAWLLVANRFLPTFRATLYIAAGASHMPYRKVLALGTLSALVWNLLLLLAGIVVGGNAERIEGMLTTYRYAAGLLILLVVGALVVRWALKRRRPAGPPAAGDDT